MHGSGNHYVQYETDRDECFVLVACRLCEMLTLYLYVSDTNAIAGS